MSEFIDKSKIRFHHEPLVNYETGEIEDVGVAYENEIDQLTVEDVMPVIHARLIRHCGQCGEVWFECSSCGQALKRMRGRYKACPYCVALFDGEVIYE